MANLTATQFANTDDDHQSTVTSDENRLQELEQHKEINEVLTRLNLPDIYELLNTWAVTQYGKKTMPVAKMQNDNSGYGQCE